MSILLLVPFAGNGDVAALRNLAPLALWIALASAVALGAASLFKRDAEQGRLEYYQLLPMALEAVVFAKWLAFFGFLLVPLLAALPVAGLLFGLGVTQLLHNAVGLAAGAAALSIISAMVAAITSGMEKAGAITSLVILPLAIPVMIAGSAYCRDAANLWQPQLLFMLAVSAFLLPLLCFVGAHSIRASN